MVKIMKKLVSVAMVVLMLSVAVPVSASTVSGKQLSAQMDIVYKDFVQTFLVYQKTKDADLYNKLVELKAKHDKLLKEKAEISNVQ